MLLRINGAQWSTGVAQFLDHLPEAPGTATNIVVRCSIPSFFEFHAIIDTAAPFSILQFSLACLLGWPTGDGEAKTLHSWRGDYDGALERIQIEIPADEGNSLITESTFFVAKDWTGANHPNFLGWNGILERLRFAIDPGNNNFHFGALP